MRFTRNTFKETTIFFFIFAAVSLAGCGSGSGADRTEETLVYYQLNYGAEAGGSVSNARQTVGREEDGSPVTVTPADGYHFIGWSDGKNDNPRTDTNITGNIGVVALFARLEYSLIYSYGAGGGLSGETEQAVPHGEDGAEVTAVPGLASVFVEWSDGILTASRADTNVTEDVRVIARFRQIPWLTTAHHGPLTVRVLGPQTAVVDWPMSESETYNLVVTKDPATDIADYASFGAIRYENVVPPFELDDLDSGEPVYLALEVIDSVSSWTSFTPLAANGFDRPVRALAIDADGIRYAGGEFTHAGLQTGHGVALPLATSGAAHPLAWPFVNDDILVAIPDREGGWYIGGRFTEVAGEPRNRLAQIDARGRLTAWSPSTNNSIHALAFDDNIIYAGGAFSQANGEQREHLAAFDTDGDLLGWNPGTNNPVWALAISDSTVYAGGWFNVAGGEQRKYLAAFDTQGELLSWNPSTDGAVVALSIEDGVVYGGGHFTHASDASRNYLAAFDTAGQLQDWAPNASGPVNALLADGGVIYAGGRFTHINGESRGHLAAITSAGELLDWSPEVSSDVYSLATEGDVIYVGGQFTRAGGQERGYFAAFDSAGQLLDWNPQGGNTVEALAVNDGAVFAGGQFSRAGGQARERLAAFDRTGRLLDWSPRANQAVNTLAIHDDAVYVVGDFTAIGDQARLGLAKIDLSGQLQNWSPEIAGGSRHRRRGVTAIAVNGPTVYLAGNFSSVNGEPREYLAAVDARGNLLNWDPAPNNFVNAIAVDGDAVYVGGSFTSISNQSRYSLAAFDQNGALLDWSPNVGRRGVHNLTVGNDTVYATHPTTFDRQHTVVAFDAGGEGEKRWEVETNLGNSQAALYAANGKVVIGGGSAAGSPRYLAAFDASGRRLDWNVEVNAAVLAISGQEDTLVLGGGFTRIGSQPRGRTASVEIGEKRVEQ